MGEDEDMQGVREKLKSIQSENLSFKKAKTSPIIKADSKLDKEEQPIKTKSLNPHQKQLNPEELKADVVETFHTRALSNQGQKKSVRTITRVLQLASNGIAPGGHAKDHTYKPIETKDIFELILNIKDDGNYSALYENISNDLKGLCQDLTAYNQSKPSSVVKVRDYNTIKGKFADIVNDSQIAMCEELLKMHCFKKDPSNNAKDNNTQVKNKQVNPSNNAKDNNTKVENKEVNLSNDAIALLEMITSIKAGLDQNTPKLPKLTEGEQWILENILSDGDNGLYDTIDSLADDELNAFAVKQGIPSVADASMEGVKNMVLKYINSNANLLINERSFKSGIKKFANDMKKDPMFKHFTNSLEGGTIENLTESKNIAELIDVFTAGDKSKIFKINKSISLLKEGGKAAEGSKLIDISDCGDFIPNTSDIEKSFDTMQDRIREDIKGNIMKTVDKKKSFHNKSFNTTMKYLLFCSGVLLVILGICFPVVLAPLAVLGGTMAFTGLLVHRDMNVNNTLIKDLNKKTFKIPKKIQRQNWLIKDLKKSMVSKPANAKTQDAQSLNNSKENSLEGNNPNISKNGVSDKADIVTTQDTQSLNNSKEHSLEGNNANISQTLNTAVTTPAQSLNNSTVDNSKNNASEIKPDVGKAQQNDGKSANATKQDAQNPNTSTDKKIPEEVKQAALQITPSGMSDSSHLLNGNKSFTNREDDKNITKGSARSLQF